MPAIQFQQPSVTDDADRKGSAALVSIDRERRDTSFDFRARWCAVGRGAAQPRETEVVMKLCSASAARR
jgi:hypothetical protein